MKGSSTIITIPAGTKFLNEVLTELPKNALFNKGKAGCGGTTIALTDNKNYIIAVPTIHLAENKAEQTNGAFAFTGRTSVTKLKKYLQQKQVKKILVTYDSLPKLTDITGFAGFHLLVDEYHLLFTQYSFRGLAVNGVLKCFTRFDSFTFMTATPLEDDFILDELTGIDKVTASWEEPNTVMVQSVKCTNVLATVINSIQAFLDGTAVGNAYFFINSVDFINELIKRMGLSDEDTRVICSPYNEKDIGLQKSNLSSEPKKINLLTSTCFEGVDLYDEHGKIFVVSDDKKQHTLLDISTSLPQITGRIRNTQYNTMITHLYSTTAGELIAYEDYKKSIINEQKHAVQAIKELNSLTPYTLAGIPFVNIQYVSKGDDGKYFLDKNQVKQTLYNYKIKSFLYSSQAAVIQETQQYGFTVKQFSSMAEIDSAFTFTDNELYTGLSLQEVVEELEKRGYKKHSLYTYLSEAFDQYPFVKEAIDKLGFDGIRACNYKKGEIEKSLIVMSNKDDYNKIISLLDKENSVKPGNFISSSQLKKVLAKIYQKMDFKIAATASDIKRYFDAKETVKKVNRKSVKGFLLGSKRMVSPNLQE